MQIHAYFGYGAINVYPFVTCVQLHYCTMYPLYQYIYRSIFAYSIVVALISAVRAVLRAVLFTTLCKSTLISALSPGHTLPFQNFSGLFRTFRKSTSSQDLNCHSFNSLSMAHAAEISATIVLTVTSGVFPGQADSYWVGMPKFVTNLIKIYMHRIKLNTDNLESTSRHYFT